MPRGLGGRFGCLNSTGDSNATCISPRTPLKHRCPQHFQIPAPKGVRVLGATQHVESTSYHGWRVRVRVSAKRSKKTAQQRWSRRQSGKQDIRSASEPAATYRDIDSHILKGRVARSTSGPCLPLRLAHVVDGQDDFRLETINSSSPPDAQTETVSYADATLLSTRSS